MSNKAKKIAGSKGKERKVAEIESKSKAEDEEKSNKTTRKSKKRKVAEIESKSNSGDEEKSDKTTRKSKKRKVAEIESKSKAEDEEKSNKTTRKSKKRKVAEIESKSKAEDEEKSDKATRKDKKRKVAEIAYGFQLNVTTTFQKQIPYYLETKAANTLAAELKAQQINSLPNGVVVAVYDMSGMGKTSMFIEAAKQAGAYCFIANVSNYGPFARVHSIIEDLILPEFADGKTTLNRVLKHAERVLACAFAITLQDIKEMLAKTQQPTTLELTKNGLQEALEERDNFENRSRNLLQEVIDMLKGTPAVILHDELQLFRTNLSTIKQADLPRYVYEVSNPALKEYGWKDFLIAAYYRTLFPLASIAQKHHVFFCQAGTYAMEHLMVHSPCRPLESISEELPLPLFDLAKCKKLFDHFWRFNITESEKEALLQQLVGPPVLMQLFFQKLSKLKTPAAQANHATLQERIDATMKRFEARINNEVAEIQNIYEDYVSIVLYPGDFGGEVTGNMIYYKPGTKGFDILNEKGRYFTDSSVLRIHRQPQIDGGKTYLSYAVEMPSRAVQLVMSHVIFHSKIEQYNDLLAVLSNKGNAMEVLLLYEFCEPLSPLWNRISIHSKPDIKFNVTTCCKFTSITELNKQEEDFIARIADGDGGHTQGGHKIDVAIKIGDTLIAIQSACLEFADPKRRQAKLNEKFRKAIKAFAEHLDGLKAERIIFVFASLFDFALTKDTTDLITACKHQMEVIKLSNFDDCIFPFYLLQDKAKLQDGSEINKLIKLYYQRISGASPPNSVGVFANPSVINLSKRFDERFASLFTEKELQLLRAILNDEQHAKHTLLTLLIQGQNITPLEFKNSALQLIPSVQ